MNSIQQAPLQEITKRVRRPHPKSKFTQEEDEKLRAVVLSTGEDWPEVSKKMPGRNQRQCKERWENYLSPRANISPFTFEEDLLLLTKYEELGPHWVSIAKSFNGRSDTAIKSRFMVLRRRGITQSILQAQLYRISMFQQQNIYVAPTQQYYQAIQTPTPPQTTKSEPEPEPEPFYQITSKAEVESSNIDREIESITKNYETEIEKLWAVDDEFPSFSLFDI